MMKGLKMGGFSFSSPTDWHNQVANGIVDAALSIDGGTQTTILTNFPTSTTWPTFAQLNTAENIVRNIYDGKMNTARATKLPASVATVNNSWIGLCGFRSIFDAARERIIRAANNEGGLGNG